MDNEQRVIEGLKHWSGGQFPYASGSLGCVYILDAIIKISLFIFCKENYLSQEIMFTET